MRCGNATGRQRSRVAEGARARATGTADLLCPASALTPSNAISSRDFLGIAE